MFSTAPHTADIAIRSLPLWLSRVKGPVQAVRKTKRGKRLSVNKRGFLSYEMIIAKPLSRRMGTQPEDIKREKSICNICFPLHRSTLKGLTVFRGEKDVLYIIIQGGENKQNKCFACGALTSVSNLFRESEISTPWEIMGETRVRNILIRQLTAKEKNTWS